MQQPPKKPLSVIDIIVDMALVRSDEGQSSYNEMLEKVYFGYMPEQREAIDKFLIMMCGATFSHIHNLGIDRETVEEFSAMNRMQSMTNDQKLEYKKIAGYLDLFLDEMKDRFAEKIKAGRRGFDQEGEIPVPVYEEILNRIPRMVKGDKGVGIGMANWGFIDWFRRNVI
jgi:hypothetical protein